VDIGCIRPGVFEGFLARVQIAIGHVRSEIVRLGTEMQRIHQWRANDQWYLRLNLMLVPHYGPPKGASIQFARQTGCLPKRGIGTPSSIDQSKIGG
jgi:hypothetical protein